VALGNGSGHRSSITCMGVAIWLLSDVDKLRHLTRRLRPPTAPRSGLDQCGAQSAMIYCLLPVPRQPKNPKTGPLKALQSRFLLITSIRCTSRSSSPKISDYGPRNPSNRTALCNLRPRNDSISRHKDRPRRCPPTCSSRKGPRYLYGG
jgi:hypothetical protein